MSLVSAGLPRQLSAPFAWALVWPQCGRGLTVSPVSPGAALYSRLKEYLLTEGQLKENGYPFPHPEKPGGAIIFTAEEKKPKDCEYPAPPPWGAGVGEGSIWGWSVRANGCGHRVLGQAGWPDAHRPTR